MFVPCKDGVGVKKRGRERNVHTHTHSRSHLFFVCSAKKKRKQVTKNKKEIFYFSSHNFTNKLCHQFKIHPITHCLQLQMSLSDKQKTENIWQPGAGLNIVLLIELTPSQSSALPYYNVQWMCHCLFPLVLTQQWMPCLLCYEEKCPIKTEDRNTNKKTKKGGLFG